jgi:hypothetical protein
MDPQISKDVDKKFTKQSGFTGQQNMDVGKG